VEITIFPDVNEPSGLWGGRILKSPVVLLSLIIISGEVSSIFCSWSGRINTSSCRITSVSIKG
jgi:hypothetical protein